MLNLGIYDRTHYSIYRSQSKNRYTSNEELAKMKIGFREHHTLNILNAFDLQTIPLDVFLRNYFRTHKAVGSKDRKEICESIYGIIRWKGLLDYLLRDPPTWKSRYERYQNCNPSDYINDLSIPAHVRASFPKSFYQLLEQSLGPELAFNFCLSSNEPAPTTVRVNALRISRSELLNKWKGSFNVFACAHSPHAISFKQKINFFGLDEFKEGYFEVQDEASQLIADLIDARPGDHILDFCSGSGGKTLAIAPKMRLEGTASPPKLKGQLYLHDIRPHALIEAKKRLKRAGIQNAQLVCHDSPQKKLLKGRMDWVLVDAPCSGSGTLRRNPDMKWKFDDQIVERLVLEQRAIFQEALAFLKPQGKIVYATCSVLPQENRAQVDYFLEHFPVELLSEPFQSFPQKGGMDGFFGAVFKRK